jgi:SpoVK/Ycf46/Vps4 family AAA+-type ATPase
VVWNENAFESLVLKANYKELIQALVTNHLENNEGLIMLLHGPPGTGKTLTAETVAELAKKPLYRVTCGDVRRDAENVEKYLESVLYLGRIWDCVVLVDEADIFLEERTQNDMARNALVSVFLRGLEYVNGISLLTTNRVGVFDEAFRSRIHLALHYPPLDEEGRAKIWDNFFKALHRAEAEMDFDDLGDNVKILARKELNGRQIRNVIKTARQLAAFRKQRFGMQHLECSIEVVKEFEKYLVDTRGPDDYYARQQRIRYN